MATYIKQGNIFGRIGTGIGKGLSEQVPKEIERSRLASGLKDFESEHENLTPVQQLARLSSIPGITPQMIQSFSELAKIQNKGNAFKNAAEAIRPQPGTQSQASPDLTQQQQAKIIQDASQSVPAQSEKINNQQRTPNIGRTEDIPQTNASNPLDPKNLTVNPWTPEQRNQRISDYISQGFLPEQAQQLAGDDESRELAQPGANKARQEEIDTGKAKVRDTLKRHLETKLQKSGEDVFKDVEGPMILNAERGMTRDLILNPKADIDNIANDWSDRLYRTAIAKNKLTALGEQTGIENFFKGDQSLKKLKEYQDIFKKSGNLEEYYNLLREKLGMSPQASASVAYPVSKKINSYISSFKPSKSFYNQSAKGQEGRKAALELQDNIGPEDSVLSIARALSEKDPYFDQQSFFDQLSDSKDEIGLSPRQRLELAEGVKNILPNWADLKYLPIIRR